MCNLPHTRNTTGRSKVHFKTKKSKNPFQPNSISRKFPIHFMYWLFPQIFNANCTGIWIRLKGKITIRKIWLRWISSQRPPLGARRATFDGRIVFIMDGVWCSIFWWMGHFFFLCLGKKCPQKKTNNEAVFKTFTFIVGNICVFPKRIKSCQWLSA